MLNFIFTNSCTVRNSPKLYEVFLFSLLTAGLSLPLDYFPFLLTEQLDNGKEVDNTYKRKQPFRFKVASGQVVKGWDEAVKQLSVGEKASCTFPANLAYGAKGFPGLIPPHSNLHVIIELVAIMISD